MEVTRIQDSGLREVPNPDEEYPVTNEPEKVILRCQGSLTLASNYAWSFSYIWSVLFLNLIVSLGLF